MNWPSRFFLPILKDWISSKMWRGLAVRTPQTQRDVGGLGSDVIDAVTGQRFNDDDVALTVISKGNLVLTTSSTGTWLPALVGVRYFIHSVHITYNQVVTDTGTFAGVSVYSGGTYYVVASVMTPGLVAQNATVVFPNLDIITDTNQAVTTTVTGSFTGIRLTIVYSIISVEV